MLLSPEIPRIYCAILDLANEFWYYFQFLKPFILKYKKCHCINTFFIRNIRLKIIPNDFYDNMPYIQQTYLK